MDASCICKGRILKAYMRSAEQNGDGQEYMRERHYAALLAHIRSAEQDGDREETDTFARDRMR